MYYGDLAGGLREKSALSFLNNWIRKKRSSDSGALAKRMLLSRDIDYMYKNPLS